MSPSSSGFLRGADSVTKTVVAALPLLASCLGLVLLSDLAQRPFLFFSLLACAFAGLVWATWCFRRLDPTVGSILWTAVLLRLLLLAVPPTLSDDIFRYLWDGTVVAAGFNPYALAPEAEELADLRDDLWLHVSHREVETVYPPAAMALFSIAARAPFPLMTLKVLLCVADLLGCWLLVVLARRAGIPARRTLWYCWNPLVVLETAGMGHVDALGVPAILGTVLLLRRQPPAMTEAQPASRRAFRILPQTLPALTATAGVLTKLVPLVAVPLWARQSGRPKAFLLVCGLVGAAAALPVVLATGGVPPGLVTYGVSWEFNGPFFEPLWRLLDVGGVSSGVKRALDLLKAASGHHDLWNLFYPFVYPQFLAKGLLAAALLVIIAQSWWRSGPLGQDSGSAIRASVVTTGRLMGGTLLLSATLYPWYLLWILPWAALCHKRNWLVLSATIQLAYAVELFGVPLVPWVYLGIWVPFGVTSLVERKWSID